MGDYVQVFADDVATFMGVDTLDEDRAELLIELAESECRSIIDPLPENARRVVLTVVARAYSNPQGVTSEATGPFIVSRPLPGVYLTKGERASLTRAGMGGAFTIDPTPADAGPTNSWPQVAYLPGEGDAFYDFDPIP